MLGILKKINRLLREPLIWILVNKEERKYITSKYDEAECWLIMNDFPDEPLWTLFYKGEIVNIEDTPFCWKIDYPKG